MIPHPEQQPAIPDPALGPAVDASPCGGGTSTIASGLFGGPSAAREHMPFAGHRDCTHLIATARNPDAPVRTIPKED